MSTSVKIQYPDGLAEAAKQFGVKLGDQVNIDPTTSLIELSEELHVKTGDADPFGFEEFGDEHFGADNFGFSLNPFKKIKKKVTGNLAAKAKTPAGKAAAAKLAKAPMKVDVKRTAIGLAKGISKGVAVASFVVPGVGPLIGSGALAAMAAADKVLGDPKLKEAAKMISNTKALAALGDKGAQRGVAVLSAVQKIRTTNKVPVGKTAIPLKTPAAKTAAAKAVKKTIVKKTPAQVKTIAKAAVIKASASGKPGWWKRFVGWLKG